MNPRRLNSYRPGGAHALLFAFALCGAACSGDGSGDRGTDAADTGDTAGADEVDGSGDAGALAPQPITPTPTPRCTELDVWQDWRLGWADLNHRISVFGVRFVAPEAGCTAAAADIEFVGGDFTSGEVATDEAVFDATVRRLALDPALAGATRVRVAGVTEPGGLATGTLELDLTTHGLDPYDTFVVWLDGLYFDTDTPQADDYPTDYEPRLGWTSRGLGASVRVVERDGDTLRLAWTARFEPGLSEDDAFRETMNDAIPFARVATSLDIAVLGLAPGVASATAEGSYELAFDEPYAGTRDLEPFASEEERRLALPGRSEAPAGFVALTGFDLVLDPPSDCTTDADCDPGDVCDGDTCARQTGDPGYYVRALGTGARAPDAADPDGTLPVELRGYASSASRFFAFRPLRYTASHRVVRVQLDVASDAAPLTAIWPFGPIAVPLDE